MTPHALLNEIKQYIHVVPKYLELIFPFRHSAHIKRHRAKIISERVGLLSLLFAIVIPIWVVIDFFAFSWPTWAILAILRLLSAVIFFGLYQFHTQCKNLNQAYLLLGGMLAVPPVFYLISQPFLIGLDTSTMGTILIGAYALLPFIVVAGLSVFPLTAMEVFMSGTLLLSVVILGTAQNPVFDLENFIITIWLMIMVIGVSMFSGMSQLHYMITLINQASKDLLTDAFTRRSGEEFLDLQFRIAARTKKPLTVFFMDIDKFKSVNDEFGHEHGDKVLKQTAKNLQACLRDSDQLIRWGGEEFIIILPNTDSLNSLNVIHRITEQTFGERPDGTPVSVSIGISEIITDSCDDWVELVEKADHRMYKAKNAGRNKSVGPIPELCVEKIIET